MILVKFKNLEKSDIARETVKDRVQLLIQKFPDLSQSKIQVTLEMENSPTQAGPDLFSVKIHVARGRYDGVTINKGASSLYVALAEVIDDMLERLNRFGDRLRVKEIATARKVIRQLKKNISIEQQSIV